MDDRFGHNFFNGKFFGLTLGRTLRIASLTMVMPSAQEMLFKIFKGDYNSMSRFGSTMMSVNTILSFFIQPYSGAIMDYYGRWPMLVLPPFLVGVVRIWLGLNKTYIYYIPYNRRIGCNTMASSIQSNI